MRSNSIKTLENRIKPSKLVKTRSNSGKNPVKRDNTKPVEENPVKKKQKKTKRKKKGRGNETEREKETGRKNERRKRRVMKRKKREKKSKKKGPVG